VVLGVAANQARRLLVNFDPTFITQVDDVIASRFGVQIDVTALQEAL